MGFRSPHPDVRIPDLPLGDLVFGGAQAHLDRPALVDGVSRTISFGELLAQIRAVAAGAIVTTAALLGKARDAVDASGRGALMRGATLVTLPRFELESFLKVLQDWPIALAHIVPPVAVALAKHPVVDNYRFPHLKWLFSGAAPLGPELTGLVRQRLGVMVRQGYGMTECSPASHYTTSDAPRDGMIGPLVACTEGRIVDPVTGADLGVGEPGEVWVRGPQ